MENVKSTQITTHELVLLQKLQKDYEETKKLLIQEIYNEILKSSKILKQNRK
jgi:hypothetical protein